MTYDKEHTMIAENISNKIIINVREKEITSLKKEIKELHILTSNTQAAYKIRELKTELKTLNHKLEQIELNEQEGDDKWLQMIAFFTLGMVFGIIVALL